MMKKLNLRKRDDSSELGVLDKGYSDESSTASRIEDSRNNISEIMRGDFFSAFKNPIVILLLVGIMILPSLYSLVNIYACWDPYEHTDNVQFAIANDDQGAKYKNYTVNAGKDLVDSLENNTDFNWTFVSSDELRRGVHDGTYYAGIIIPPNFSDSIVSITTDKPHSAELEYVVNEKANPVAAKLGDAASKAIFNRLNNEIVSFIDVAAYDELVKLQEGMAEGSQEMGEGADLLEEGADEVASGADKLENGAHQLENGADVLASGANDLAVGANTISGYADLVAKGTKNMSDKTQELEVISNDTYKRYVKIRDAIENLTDTSGLSSDVANLNRDVAKLAEDARQLDNQSSNVSQNAVNLSDATRDLSNNASNLAVGSANMADKTQSVSANYDNLSKHMAQLNEAIKNNESKSKINEILEIIDKDVNTTRHNITELNNKTHLLAAGASGVDNGTHQLAAGSKKLANGAYQLSNGVQVLSDGTIKLASGAELLGYSSASALRNASDALGEVADELAPVTDLDDDQVRDYFLGPVKLKRTEEFPTNNFGSQVAPFYLVLSMWVGALINTVILRTGSSVGSKYKSHEVYIGKLIIFNIMAFLQTTVTMIGACIIGIDIHNPLVFAFSCYFVAIIFMAIIYSLASLFGEIGKGIGILLLVFQISGSGGVYPIEIISQLFGDLYPYLPMTHAINMVRESQLGLIWLNFLPSFAYLLIMGVSVVIVALLLKQRWDKRTKYFNDKLEESGLFN